MTNLAIRASILERFLTVPSPDHLDTQQTNLRCVRVLKLNQVKVLLVLETDV